MTDATRRYPSNVLMDGRVEILCPHGAGHPSRRLTEQRRRQLGTRGEILWRDQDGKHGCCGASGIVAAAAWRTPDRCCTSAEWREAEEAHYQVREQHPLHEVVRRGARVFNEPLAPSPHLERLLAEAAGRPVPLTPMEHLEARVASLEAAASEAGWYEHGWLPRPEETG